jgi:hypothetical protein
VSRADISRQAEELLYRELQPGEHVAGGAEVTANPSRWGLAVLVALTIALMGLGLACLFGSLTYPPAGGFAATSLPVVGLLLRRRMLVVVTSQRLICLRRSRSGREPRPLVFAAALAEVRVAAYRPRTHSSSIQFEIPGHKRIWLETGRAGRKDFALVEEALARAGALARLDPPWPATSFS